MDLRRQTEQELEDLRCLLGQPLIRVASRSFELSVSGEISTAPDGNFVLESRACRQKSHYIILENHQQDTNGIWDLPKVQVSKSDYPLDFRIPYQSERDPALPYETYLYSSLDLSPQVRVQSIDILEICWDDEDWNDQGLRITLSDERELVFTVDNSIVRQVTFGFQPEVCARLMEYMRVRLSLA